MVMKIMKNVIMKSNNEMKMTMVIIVILINMCQ
jgi:hypothetical protein